MGYGFNGALDKLSLHFIYACKDSLIHVIIFFSKEVWIYQVFYIFSLIESQFEEPKSLGCPLRPSFNSTYVALSPKSKFTLK